MYPPFPSKYPSPISMQIYLLQMYCFSIRSSFCGTRVKCCIPEERIRTTINSSTFSIFCFLKLCRFINNSRKLPGPCTSKFKASRALALDTGARWQWWLRNDRQAHCHSRNPSRSRVKAQSVTFQGDPTRFAQRGGRRISASEMIWSRRIETPEKLPLILFFFFFFFLKWSNTASILNRETPNTIVEQWKFNTSKGLCD